MTAAVRVRSARISDAEAVAALSGELGYPQGAAEASGRLPALLCDPDHLVLVGEVQDRALAGWIHARYCIELAVEPFVEILDEGAGGPAPLPPTVQVGAPMPSSTTKAFPFSHFRRGIDETNRAQILDRPPHLLTDTRDRGHTRRQGRPGG